MSLSNDILAGVLAVGVVVGLYAIYAVILLAFLWAVWNWIILPTLPYAATVFA